MVTIQEVGTTERAAFQPLAGLKVVEFTEGVAGPCVCQMLGDLGAHVIKVERPQGDWGRQTGEGGSATGGPHFRAVNRNKRDICLDLRSPRGLAVAERLVDRADVMVTSYRPGVMERLGLGYAEVASRVPGMIYVRISAYGYEGPLAERPGSDTILQAVSGLMSQIGDPDGYPQRVGIPITDMVAARDAVVGVLASLMGRARGLAVTGPVDVTLFGSAAALQGNVWQKYLEDGSVQARSGNRNPGIAPAGVYETKDGRYIAVAVLRSEHWMKFCEALGLEDVAADPRFSSNANRLANREELENLVTPIFQRYSCDELVSMLVRHDVLVAPVTDVSVIFGDESMRRALPVIEIAGGTGKEDMQGIGLPISFGGHSRFGSAGHAPPAQGEHSRQILVESGYSEAEVETLIASGVALVGPLGGVTGRTARMR